MSERIRTGDIEPIQLFVTDASGAPLTGKTDLFVHIRRDSDGQFLDWTNFPTSTTFSATPVDDDSPAFVEVSAVRAPGIYELTGDWDTGAITNAAVDDEYLVVPFQSPGTDAVLPTPGKIRVGQWVDDAVLVRKCMTNRLELAAGDPGTLTLHDDDDSVLLTWEERNPIGGAISIGALSPARRTKAT